MAFTDTQVRKLRAPISHRHVKEREVEGKILHYVEGWHVVAEANRIFGFDAWDRETVSSQCVWQKQIDHRFAAAYQCRVRISVRAGETLTHRDGLGSGESVAATAGQAHEWAAKAAETDATKRALSTFGNSFGLSLYRDKSQPPKGRKRPGSLESSRDPHQAPGSTTILQPIAGTRIAMLPVRLPPEVAPVQPARIDKSELALSEPKRHRSREHLRFVARQPCLVCGRAPSQAHHLRFSQPRALGRKVSDEFTVPLCAIHHHELHTRGSEVDWWCEKALEPLAVADALWRASGTDESVLHR